MATIEEVTIEASGVTLGGSLTVPDGAGRLVIFAHGSGSSRFSRRNCYVAELMNSAALGTLLFDLLTAGEDEVDAVTRQFRFDIPLLASRLVNTIDWTRRQDSLSGLSIGLFGASTGAAAALIAAAERPSDVQAVVSRGGRPDLAGGALPKVTCPTLLLVGGDDTPVIGLNETARDAMTAHVELHIIRGATHLFEEAGKLDEVANEAKEWFLRHLPEAKH
jgi:pimeloyl-ACP methyl ester carboxylesterase